MNNQSLQSDQTSNSLIQKYQQLKKQEENIDSKFTQKNNSLTNKKNSSITQQASGMQSPSSNSNQQAGYYFPQSNLNGLNSNQGQKKYNINSLSSNFGKIQIQKTPINQTNSINLSGMQQQSSSSQKDLEMTSNQNASRKLQQYSFNSGNINSGNTDYNQNINTGKTHGLNLQIESGIQSNKIPQDEFSSPQTNAVKAKRSDIYTTNSVSSTSMSNLYQSQLQGTQQKDINNNSSTYNSQNKIQQLLQQTVTSPQTQKSNPNKLFEFSNKFESQSTKSALSKNHYNFFSEQIQKISNGSSLSSTNNNANNNISYNNLSSNNANNSIPSANNSLREGVNNKDQVEDIHKRYSISRQFKNNMNSISSYIYNNSQQNNVSYNNQNQIGGNSNNNNASSYLTQLQKSQNHSLSSESLHQQLAPLKNTLNQNITSQVFSNNSLLFNNNNNSNNDYNSIDVLKNYVIPNHESTKFSVKRNGIVKCYSANTNQGLIRNYNEDRVSIILNIMKPNGRSEENWPKCSFFGVYDGHGGVQCADFLRDNLHQFVIKDQNFPWNPVEAIKNGFDAAETKFLKQIQENSRDGVVDKSGSCAIVVLIVGDMCYVANVGDSRAIISSEGGKNIYNLSRDHKPSDEVEYNRIIEAGGKVYQTKVQTMTESKLYQSGEQQYILGPHRVLPGRLSVTRTFGDIEAKMPKYNGNPKVVIATPDIKSFKVTENHEFIVLASDGIYDKLSTQEVGQCVWDTKKVTNSKNIHQYCGDSVESIFKLSLYKKTLDNITVVIIGFDAFKKKVFPKTEQTVEKKSPITSKQSNQNINSNNISASQQQMQSNTIDRQSNNNGSNNTDLQQQQQLRPTNQQYHFYRNYKPTSISSNNQSQENMLKKERDHLYSQQIDRNKLTDIYSENHLTSYKNSISGLSSIDKYNTKSPQQSHKKDENQSGLNSTSSSTRQNYSIKNALIQNSNKVVGTSSTNLINNALDQQQGYTSPKQQSSSLVNKGSNMFKSGEKWKEDFQLY